MDAPRDFPRAPPRTPSSLSPLTGLEMDMFGGIADVYGIDDATSEDESFDEDVIMLPENNPQEDDAYFYTAPHFVTLMQEEGDISVGKIRELVPFFDSVLDHFKGIWFDTQPEEGQSRYDWLLKKVTDEEDPNEGSFSPLQVEHLFDTVLIGLYRIFAFCRRTSDEEGKFYINDNQEGLDRQAEFARLVETVKLCKDYMLKHAMFTFHMDTLKYGQLAQAEKTISMISDGNLKPWQVVESFLLDRFQELGLRHHKDYCYTRIIAKNGTKTMAWKPLMLISEFIPTEITPEKNYSIYRLYTGSPSYNMNNTFSRFFTKDSKQTRFPALKPNRYLRSFNNGFFHILHLAFYDYNDKKNWPAITARKIIVNADHDPKASEYVAPTSNDTCLKHFDLDFVWGELINNCNSIMDIDSSEIETPELDKILQYQRLEPDTIRNVYCLIGRLFYDVKRFDDWQLMLYFKGVAQSGKSSILNFIQECFDYEAFGILNSNCQDQFMLEHIFEAEVVATFEAKRQTKIDQATLQQCISGEKTTVNQKGKKSFDKIWTSQFVMAANEILGVRDAAGSVARRLALFLMNYKVVAQDEEMGKRMVKQIADYLLKFNLIYRQEVFNSEKKGWWSIRSGGTSLASPQMLAYRDEVIADLQPLVNFIVKAGIFDLVLIDESLDAEECYINEKVFVDKYRMFCRDLNLNMGIWNSDLYKTVFDDYKIVRKQAHLPTEGGVLVNGYFLFGIREKPQDDDM